MAGERPWLVDPGMEEVGTRVNKIGGAGDAGLAWDEVKALTKGTLASDL